jgi:predicted MFS family arabinose efflux permease
MAARRHAGDRPQAFWVFMMAAAAAAVVFGESPPLFFVGITLWGFSFWMSTPPILRAIAAWSLAPEERVGDAQSTMAVGRAAGPAIGSILVGSGQFGALGWFAVSGLTVSGLIVLAVRIYRRSHRPPGGAVAAATAGDVAG